ncbi:Hpt domain-containing protein [Pseudoalteromonas sp. DY56-GL79]|uniref:Hpt domain-containing protein n=1 Tax=Pseudoalteromonas sp. DY56-GL79 TaxID=2967131 RepID=UPI00352A755A
MSIVIDEGALENMQMLLGEQFEDTVHFCCSEFERLESELMLNLNQDQEAAIRHAHSLKSNAAQFGAASLSDLAKTIEHALIQEEKDIVDDSIEKLAAQVAGSKAKLQQWVRAQS